MDGIKSLFYDPKLKCYSASRVVMVTGAALATLVILVIITIVLHAYFSGAEIPSLEWLLWGGVPSAAGTAGGYIMNQWANRSTEVEEEGVVD